MSKAIEINNLGKQYRRKELGGSRYQTLRDALWTKGGRKTDKASDYFWALRNLDLSIEQGSIVGVIGPNGAGKSTLLKLLSRVTSPTEGSFTLRGRVASLLEVGTGFHPELTGRENIFLSGAVMGMRRTEIQRRFDEIVAFSGVEKFLDLPVKRYSSGMYVRLGFAIAAHLEAEILLVDEVLAVGDAAFQKKCLGKIGDVAQSGRTVLFVSHNLGAVQQLCEQSMLIDNGGLSSLGKTLDIITNYSKAAKTHEGPVFFKKTAIEKLLHITAIGLVKEAGKYINKIGYGELIKFQVEVDSQISTADYYIILGLNDHVGTRIITVSGIEDYKQVTLKKGKSKLTVSLSSRKLKPGFYGVYFAVVNGFEDRIDTVKTSSFFEILNYSEDDYYKGYWGHILDTGEYVVSDEI